MTAAYDETELLRAAQAGDKDSQNLLISGNMGLVKSIAIRFYNRGHDPDDILQLGMLGLYKAIKKFDFSYGVKLSTYAVPMITGEIKRFIRDDGMVKVSRSLKELSLRIREEAATYENENGRQPTVSELSAALKIDKDDIISAISSSDCVTSLDGMTGDDSGMSVIEKIEDKRVKTEEEMINTVMLKELLSLLKPRERQIITMRYFMELTQQQVSAQVGISQVQVSRIEKKVLRRMRENIK